MMKRSFSILSWLFGSFLTIVLINLGLICLVSGVDVFLGQPPQFIFPLVALLIVCATLMLSRRRASQAESLAESEPASTANATSRRTRRHPVNVPAYVSMTIIRRPPVYASTPVSDKWEGVVQ